jgi:nitrous oxidase accessory protein NosD
LLWPAAAVAATVVVEPGQPVAAKLARLRAGDVLLLKAGRHREGLAVGHLNGTQSSPVWIRGEPGAVIVPAGRDGILLYPGKSSYVVIEGLRVEDAPRAGILVANSHHVLIRNCTLGDNGVWGVQTMGSDHVRVENCEIYGSKQQHGIYFSTTDHPVARGNRIHDNRRCGIHTNGDKGEGGDGMITGALYENNVIYRNGSSGAAINLDGVEKSVVRNNLIYENRAGGIVSFHSDGDHTGSGNEVTQNTVYFTPGAGRFGLQLRGGARDTVVTDNILVCGRGPALEVDRDSLRGLRSDRNLLLRLSSTAPVELDGGTMTLKEWQAETSQDSRSVSADPQFTEVSKGDFRPRAGSPAVGLGYRP